jgi:hypothetical protein
MRQRWWLVAVGFVICMGMTVLPAGAQLPVPTPTVPTPTVPTPPVPTPPVPTPPVPAPPELPPVPTPPVPKPPPPPAIPTAKPPPAPAPSTPVHVPSVTVPSVKTPSVTTPAGTVSSTSTPSVRTPGSATPRAGGTTGSGASGSGSGSASGSAGGGSGSVRSAAAGSTPGSATSSGTSANGADGQSSGSSNAKPKTRAARVQQRERNLRRTVLRFHGCLSRVPRSERRVLSLRAGVGRLRPHTRSQVARITHLRRARVIQLERRGLSRLRALNRAGACQDATATRTVAMPAPGTGTPVPPAGGSAQRSGVLAEHHSSASSKDGGSQGTPERAELSISRPATSGPGGSAFDLALVLGPLAFLAFVLVITREVRRTS